MTRYANPYDDWNQRWEQFCNKKMNKLIFYFQSRINSIQKPSHGSGNSILVSSLNKNWEREWIDFFKSGFSRLEFLKTKFLSSSISTSSTQWLTASSCESLWMSQVSMWPFSIASWRFPEYVPELELTIFKNSLPWFQKNHNFINTWKNPFLLKTKADDETT